MSDETSGAPKYRVEHAIQSAIGDYANVNNYFPPQQTAADPGAAELRRLFAEVNKQLAALEAADRDAVAPTVEQTAQAAAAIQQGDASPEKQNFLVKRLKSISSMAPDIGKVIIATLANPSAGIALALQQIAQKAQDELGGKKQDAAS